MGKAKRKGPAAASVKAQPKKTNPFELKKTRTKFNVVGRRLKGTTKNVVQARQDAHNKRKSTLLVEYKALRKANTFKDKRLGEAGSDLTEDERALARLQALRVKQDAARRKKNSKFVLAEGDQDGDAGYTLTHGGRSLSEIDNLGEAPPSLDELDEDMVADLVDTYNFGGGGGEEGGKKTRKQVMEEIIAKSKAYKALKAKQKEEDEQELDKLNDEFRELVQKHSLKALMKPAGYLKGVKIAADNDEDAAYDIATRTLVTESRGAAGERTMTAEELEEREKLRLEKLEAERLRRMRGASGDDDGMVPEGFEDGPAGGYAARRKRIREKLRREQGSDEEGSDDDDEGESGGSGSDEGEGSGSDDAMGEGEDEEDDDLIAAVNKLEARRREQAAGDHPLQDSFRDQAAALLAKYGIKAKNPLIKPKDSDSDEDEDGSEGDSEEGEEGSEEGEEGESGGSDLDGEAESGDASGSESSEEDEGSEEEVGSEEEEEQPPVAAAAPKSRVIRLPDPTPSEPAAAAPKSRIIRLPDPPPAPAPAAAAGPQGAVGGQQGPGVVVGAAEDEPLDLPYTIPMPNSYQAFADLVRDRPAAHLALAIKRIRAFNAQTLAADSKKQLQVFYGMLVQHFVMLAGQSPLPLQHLDTLVQTLLAMTTEVPFYAATVARARLQKLHERLSVALNPLSSQSNSQKQSVPESPWPNSRAYLQLSLFTTLFPISDKRHPVITPLTLLACKYLSQCTAHTRSDVGMGLLVCSLAMRIAESGKRYMPEPINFLTDLLLSALPAAPTSTAPSQAAANGHTGKQSGKQKKGKAQSKQAQAQQTDTQQTVTTDSQQSSQLLSGTGGGTPRVTPGLLRLSSTGAALRNLQPQPPKLTTTLEASSQQSAAESDSYPGSDVEAAGLLAVALTTAGKAAEGVLAACKSTAPAALAPLLAALRRLGKVQSLPDSLEQQRSQLLSSLETQCRTVSHHRTPLVQSHRLRGPVIKEYIPRFEEEGFALGRDYDPDRVRAEQKKLKRQLQKEKRGAIRELRRDAAFLAAHRDHERAQVDAERLENQKRFYAELQAQEADMKSGGQAGMNPHLKKKAKR